MESLKHALLPLVLLSSPVTGQEAQDPRVLDPFDQPFLFSYLSWQDKVATKDGIALLRGINNQGGAGRNVEWDLSGDAELVPVLRLRVGPGNRAANLVLMLKDGGEGAGRWLYPLPAAGGDFVELFPQEGAALGEPNALGDHGAPDLAQIRQIQLIGDWAGGLAVEVEVDALFLRAPDETILAARSEKARRLAEAAAARRREQAGLESQFGTRTERSPEVVHISAVAPGVLAVEIQAGTLVPAQLVEYEAQEGDRRVEKKNAAGELESVLLERAGETLGWLVGPRREWLTTYERIDGDPLLDFIADQPATYRIGPADKADAASAVRPLSVGRKSHVNAWAQGPGTLAVRHTLYLKLPKPLAPGRRYRIGFGRLNTLQAEQEFTFDPARVRSEAVHVNQIGYRPDDPAKTAFVSCWLGTAGRLAQPAEVKFSLVDDTTGETAFEGSGRRHFPADQPELMAREVNFNGTDVARLDFSGFDRPGRYRVVVDGVGCSYPFAIAADAWRRAFATQMRGFYHQRSGVALGPPRTGYRKPRDMHPADGYPVTRTSYRADEGGGEDFAGIAAGDTGQPVPQAWGGYHDAGDWNPRRVTHMHSTLAMLEMLELFPDTFGGMDLNIESIAGQPDLLTEALFEFDCFRRLQQDNGGVGYGLESKGDPLAGEVSWLNSFSSYLLAPDYAASWFYAAVGARLGRLLDPLDPERAAEIRDSAVRAFAFAEADYARDHAAGLPGKRPQTWEALDSRNLAALELYTTTREAGYHDKFLEDSALADERPELFAWGRHVQREQAFHYARLPEGLGDPVLKKKAVAALRQLAERALHYAAGNAFNLTTCDKGKPQFIGFYTVPDAADLTRAHFLTGDERYLAGALRATQFQGGCNPNNLVYMTGLGANPVKNVFKLDARRTGQAVPAGLVPYGNIDFATWNDNGITWPITWIIGKATVPDAYAWPTHQAYWDLGGWPMLEEFTVDRWAPNILVWGYLAARK